MKFFIWLIFMSFLVSVSLIKVSVAKEKKISSTWSLEKLEEYQKNLKNKEFFYALGDILEKVHRLKNWEKVSFYAPRYLQEAQKYKKNWNYGNAIFYSHIALSEMAYEKGDKALARELLIKASKTPGSPQLDSFGPFNSSLVTEYILKLAKEGEKESLLEFAKNCKNFVGKKINEKEKATSSQVTRWNLEIIARFTDQIQNGKTPDFKTPGT